MSKALLGGRILTVDPSNSIHEAIFLEGERIKAVGTTEEINAYITSATEVIDLDSRAVTPGFVDSHNHTVEFGLSGLVLDLRYPEVQSIEDIKKLVEAETKRKPKGQWIKGVGWDEALLKERRAPTRFDLDPVSPDHPVILDAQTPYQILDAQTPYQVANTFAHELVAARYEESFDGIHTVDDAAYRMRQLSRNYTVEECEEAILKAQEELFKVAEGSRRHRHND